ncbi:amidase [hydrocarbon metagenome]|uniref:Amidase n=1 Tax=hydrocarbon metagenome TaxID=938273 RepID=A0A0W8FFX2_9ZZZZ
MEMLRDCRARTGIRFLPGQSALLVIDMQGYFLDRRSPAYIPAAPAIVRNVRALMDGFLARSRPIILTRHLDDGEGGGLMHAWWGTALTRDDPGSEIISELSDPAAIVMEKSQYDAFYGTELEAVLQAAGVRQVVITGVMTHLCCETTARSAFVRGYAVFLPIDGCAAPAERMHRATLTSASHGFAVPVLAETLLAALGGGGHANR